MSADTPAVLPEPTNPVDLIPFLLNMAAWAKATGRDDAYEVGVTEAVDALEELSTVLLGETVFN